MNRYSFDIKWSDEDGEYVATCPSFQGLSAFGETEEEALKEAKIALGLFIESYREQGRTLPAPVLSHSYSGQLRLRLPRSLHWQAAILAEADSTSLNQFIVCAIQSKVTRTEFAREPASGSRPKLVKK